MFVMEAIWDELCRTEAAVEVPQWHRDLLDEREQMVADGKAAFIPWDEAKRQIRDSVR